MDKPFLFFKSAGIAAALTFTLAPWIVASSAIADAVPSWLPKAMQSQIDQLPSGKSSDPLAMIYVCDPYCETIGEFFGKTEYRTVSSDATKTAQSEAQKPGVPGAQGHLRLILNPSIDEDNPSGSHEAEEMPQKTEVVDSSGSPQAKEEEETKVEESKNEEEAPKAPESQEKSADQANEEEQLPLFLGAHLDALLGSTTLKTSANTDTASDAQLHGIFGGGLDFDVKNLTPLWKGSLDLDFDLSYWGSSGQKSRQNTGQTWSSQIFRGLIGAIWQRAKSPWRLGLLIEGRQDNENASEDTAIGFSTKYFWASPGIQIQYRKTTLRILKSVFSSVQDVDQYRGTQVTSSRWGFEAESCKPLAAFLKGQFDVCAMGSLTFLGVNGSGTPLQPVFTNNPSYSYTSWSAGVEFKVVDISL